MSWENYSRNPINYSEGMTDGQKGRYIRYFAERTIRKLTTQRNNSLHYDSDAGAVMAATCHSVIGMVKLHGSSVWNFIGTFFKNIFNGCRDYVNMVPDKIFGLPANVKFKTN